MNRLIPFAACWLLMALSTAEAADEAEFVPRWQPRDFSFRADQKLENPFSVAFAAEATGPGGIRLRIPGFYDGDGTWKVRLSPTIEGDWSLVTRSSLPALDNRQAAFRCQRNPSPLVHGGLIVDPQYPRHFVYEDGTRFYLLGYECDWLWAPDLGQPDLKATEAFLDRLAASGFNYILINTYAHDTGWRKGRTGDDDFGPPSMYAWEGSNEQDYRSDQQHSKWRETMLNHRQQRVWPVINTEFGYEHGPQGLADKYHPFTGKRQDAGALSAGSAELTPPAEWGASPVVLHVGSAQR